MEEYPNNQIDFERAFNTEEACAEYLIRIRWHEGYKCPRCNHNHAWLTKNKLYKCSSCGFKTSITAGTIFQDTRKPLQLWFRAMWYVVGQKNGISAKGVQRILGFTRYETVWLWMHKLRRAMVRPGRDKLSGLVEVDEVFIGGVHKGKRGRGSEGKTLVLIAVEDKGKHIGRIRLNQIKDASSSSIMVAIRESIDTGSTIRTDGWRSYSSLAREKYNHIVARKTESVGDNLLPLVNRVSSLLKRWLGGTHQGAVEFKHLDYYLDEYTFRFNRRTSKKRGKLFYRLMQQATAIAPVKNIDIYQKKIIKQPV